MKKPHSSVRCDLAALAFLGPLEARVMDIVWARPTVTVRQVYEILRAEREIAYTTIMTILANLYKKGLLARDAEGQAHVYRAVQTKQEFVEQHVANLLDTLLDRFSEPALAHLVRRIGEADAERLAELERLVAERRRAVRKSE